MPLYFALSALAAAAVFPPGVTEADLPRLLKSTAFVRALDEKTLVQLVPQRSGLHFVGCPNCNSGRQEGQLSWSPDRPEEVFCVFCNHRYPSPRYPMRAALTVRNPRSETVSYPYWEDPRGYRYFFDARRDDLVREYLAARARELSQLYALTHDRSFARRAALILDRFAEVFPGWCYHYDYPFQQKIIYEGLVPPQQFRTGFRTSRWTWWAYNDIPMPLVQAFDWIRASGALEELSRAKGVDVAARIETDLFRNAASQVLANPEAYTNMSPTAWTALVSLGRVIGEPAYIDECVRRMRRFFETRFFYDGVWPEGAPSYHAQTVNNLFRVAELLGDGSFLPALQRSKAALMKMRLPDGRFAPMHDTWSTTRADPPPRAESYLLPALGHACLAGGRPEAPSQYHVTWSGGYGHQHADNLSLLIFGQGRELASDLGYTHTRQRAWTLATAAHNTVVIDGRNQHSGSSSSPSDGSLRWFDVRAGRIQTVSAAGERGYPGVARLYRRTLIMVEGRYAVDIFEVDGGRIHDYFLHGDADFGGTAQTPLPLESLPTLLPEGFTWRAAQNEGETRLANETWWGYGYLRNLRAAPAPTGVPLRVTLRSAGGGGLGVILLPEEGSRLVLGENPAIRGAEEDDARLDKFSRPFMMLRHNAANGRSTFVAVLESFASAPEITSVERLKAPPGAVSLRIATGGRAEVVTYTPEPASERLPLAAVEGDSLLVAGAPKALPRAGEVVRLLTADGWVYPYHVVAAQTMPAGARIRVAEGPGLVFDGASARLRLTAYPQREHSGAAVVEWLTTAAVK